MGLIRGLWKLFKYTVVFGFGVYVGSHYTCKTNAGTMLKEKAKELKDKLNIEQKITDNYHSNDIVKNIQTIINDYNRDKSIQVKFQYK